MTSLAYRARRGIISSAKPYTLRIFYLSARCDQLNSIGQTGPLLSCTAESAGVRFGDQRQERAFLFGRKEVDVLRQQNKEGLKTCTGCHEVKPLTDFYKGKRDGYICSKCKECLRKERYIKKYGYSKDYPLHKKIPKDYHALAQSIDYKWLGPEVNRVSKKTWWLCDKGHKWETPYNKIQQGRRCPYCHQRKPRRKRSADYHALAKAHGLKWLGPEVPTISTKTLWQCSEGHKWETTYRSINQDKGCLECMKYYGQRHWKTTTDYHALAKARGFKWLGPKVPNVLTKTSWQCSEGHEWEARFSAIQYGDGCPDCARYTHVNGRLVSHTQVKIGELLGGVVNYPFNGYCIDIALIEDSIKIAIEYDSWFWHADKEENDAQRDKVLMAEGWRILRIKSNTLLPSEKKLNKAIAKLRNGESYVEIILPDWGNGKIRSDVYSNNSD